MARARRTWTTMLAEIRRLLREDTAATSYWTDAQLLDMFNQSIDLRYMQLANTVEGWVVESASIDLTLGENEYAIPEGTGRPRRVMLVKTESGVTREIPLRRDELLDTEAVLRTSPTYSYDTWRPTYKLVAENVVLSSTAPQAVTGGLKIEYDAAPARLDDGADKLPLSFPDTAETVLIYDTVALALASEVTQSALGEAYTAGLLRMQAALEGQWLLYIEGRLDAAPTSGRGNDYGD
jgi:hypothetical protein